MTMLMREGCILYSGGANGTEAEFGIQAERFGIEEINYTFEGHQIARSRGVRVLTRDELLKGDVSLAYVSKLMHRTYTDAPLIRKVLQTIWYQVNSGQEIYVVGKILDDGTVKGGTGWGARCGGLRGGTTLGTSAPRMILWISWRRVLTFRLLCGRGRGQGKSGC